MLNIIYEENYLIAIDNCLHYQKNMFEFPKCVVLKLFFPQSTSQNQRIISLFSQIIKNAANPYK